MIIFEEKKKMIDPLYFKVPRFGEETVRVEIWDLPHFLSPIHIHEDSQLTFILEGDGTLIANYNIDTFSKGDILIFGNNFPHALQHDVRYHSKKFELETKAISLFFNSKLLLNFFDLIPELSGPKELLQSIDRGLKLSKKEASKIGVLIKDLQSKNGVGRILLFIEILNLIWMNSKNIKVLSDSISTLTKPDCNEKVNKVYQYLLENYMNPIKLVDVASQINMTTNAFCRFFKKRTNKTFSGLLKEVRIKKACKFLAEGNRNVTQTYLDCGYNNSSNFHRHFLVLTGMTPSQYKDRVHSKS